MEAVLDAPALADESGRLFRAGAGAGQDRHRPGNRAAGPAGALAGPLNAADPGRARPAQMGRDLARQRASMRPRPFSTVSAYSMSGGGAAGACGQALPGAALGSRGKSSPDETAISDIEPGRGSVRGGGSSSPGALRLGRGAFAYDLNAVACPKAIRSVGPMTAVVLSFRRRLARPEGFEPSTCGLEVRRSIRLS